MSSSSRSDAAALAAKLANDHVADVVKVLNGLEPGRAAEVLATMSIERPAHILGQPCAPGRSAA
jgi:flagellar motility protein MotE (MotC chaperone)